MATSVACRSVLSMSASYVNGGRGSPHKFGEPFETAGGNLLVLAVKNIEKNVVVAVGDDFLC